MAEVQWIRLYIDIFDKQKIKKIRRRSKGDKILLIWIMLLTTAGKCNASGMVYITERVPFTNEDLADEFGFDTPTIELALKTFQEFDMIDVDNGFISIRNWEKYQSADKLAELREYNRLAQQKSRTKKKRLQDVNVNDDVNDKSDNVIDISNDMSNDSHVTCHGCQGTEEEEEKDKDKEYSFIHSIARAQGNDEDFEGAVENSVENSVNEATLLAEKREKQRKHLGGIGKGVVLLSDDQIDILLKELSLEEFDKYVGIVAECELSGQKYKKKTHYQAILDMAYEDRGCKS